MKRSHSLTREAAKGVELSTKKRSEMKWPVFLIILLALSLVLSACSKDPGAEQIKADLIGKVVDVPSVRVAIDEWRFASLSEFQELYIRSKQKLGDIIEYQVSMRLQDLRTKERYVVDAVVTYKKSENKWQMVSITPMLWEIID